ncbi:hypothetical protein V3C99_003064 [Haemonchus contortus]
MWFSLSSVDGQVMLLRRNRSNPDATTVELEIRMHDVIDARSHLKHDANTDRSHRRPTESTRGYSWADRRSIISSSFSSAAGRRSWPYTLIITIRYRTVT